MSNRRDFLLQTAAAGSAMALGGTQIAVANEKAKSPGNQKSMQTYQLPHSDLRVSRIAYGCALLAGKWDKSPLGPTDAANGIRSINVALDQGITLFDHADIYCYGKSEEVFGEAFKQSPGLRNRMVIQSKCGIKLPDDPRPGDPARFDFSREHILRSVEGSLRRLRADYMDILLLHRPDPLVEPDEVASAFSELKRSGKVRHFGVSNHTAGQIALLRKSVEQPLVVNQIQISLTHSTLISDGMDANRATASRVEPSYTGTAATLDYCRLNDIQIQAYSPLRGGFLNPSQDDQPRVKATAELLTKMAKEKGTSRSAIALGWLLRHPAGFLPVIGSTKPEHIVESCQGDQVKLTREEWYRLFLTASGAPNEQIL